MILKSLEHIWVIIKLKTTEMTYREAMPRERSLRLESGDDISETFFFFVLKLPCLFVSLSQIAIHKFTTQAFLSLRWWDSLVFLWFIFIGFTLIQTNNGCITILAQLGLIRFHFGLVYFLVYQNSLCNFNVIL
jgi:hypothetical protein